MVTLMDCHQQRDAGVVDAVTHAVPNNNPAGAALCGVVVHDASAAAWRTVAHAEAWESPTRTARCPACRAIAPA